MTRHDLSAQNPLLHARHQVLRHPLTMVAEHLDELRPTRMTRAKKNRQCDDQSARCYAAMDTGYTKPLKRGKVALLCL
jgi:hypothetical protein